MTREEDIHWREVLHRQVLREALEHPLAIKTPVVTPWTGTVYAYRPGPGTRQIRINGKRVRVPV